jgi:hypothetical protein
MCIKYFEHIQLPHPPAGTHQKQNLFYIFVIHFEELDMRTCIFLFLSLTNFT